MAQLDTMLRALAERGALELRFEEGARPVFRYGDGDRPVSQATLARARIVSLVQELAGDGDRTRLGEGAAVRFGYKTADGRSFICEVNGPEATVVARVYEGAIDPPKAAAAPAPVTVPVAVPPPMPVTVSASGSPAPTSGFGVVLSADDFEAPAPVPLATRERASVAPAPAREAAGTIDALLRRMVETKASDLHLSPGEMPMVRLHGEMMRWDDVGVLDAEATARLVRSILPPRYAQQFEETNDTDFAHEIAGLARFRANLFQDRKGTGGVFRVIPSRIPSAEELGVPKAVLDLCHLSKGLVLVTGPTGSGKSTTLAALVDHINSTRSDHIITIEDPIEFVHQNRKCLVNQREVGTHTKSFKSALRAALREDPDIVLVGEMRDLETIAIAIETAETGHLVFGTLHTSTAASTVDRIIDQFPADRQAQIRVMLSESLRGVISQTLCKRIGGGRVAALEILVANTAIANLIREGKSYQIPSIMQTGKKHGMNLLNDALTELAKKKLITLEEAWLKSLDKNGIASALKALGFEPPAPTAPAH